jgi:MoaA/NifB/PqqE/SkfB family radical SAM enzyme
MAVDLRFVLTGVKRVFDSRPMYAQVVVTDDCNLTCTYCDEYTPGAPIIPLEELEKRIDKLDALGVQVYDFLGGEPMLHPHISALVRHTKSKRGGSNLATIITNGFLVTAKHIEDLNAAGLDFMQVSVDFLEPSDMSVKSLKSILPRLKILAKEARFTVEIQTVLNDATCATYDRLREILKDFPFAFGFSIMHDKGGRIAIRGDKFLSLLAKYGVFEGGNFYGDHLKEMLRGDYSRPWKCLSGFKYLYVNARGGIQWCSQQRDYVYPLELLDLKQLRANNRHKACEAGCALGCVRMVSHTLGEPLKTIGPSLRQLVLGVSRRTTKRTSPSPEPVATAR